MYGDNNQLVEALNRSFETDETGQMYYVPPGWPTKLPIEESDYLDALAKLEIRMRLTKIAGFVVLCLSAAGLFFIATSKRGFEMQDALWLLVPVVFYLVTIMWATYSSVRPLEVKRMQADGTKSPTRPMRWAARVGGAVVGAIVIYYLINPSR